MIKNIILSFIASCLFITTACCFGQSEEEIQKMRQAMPESPVVQPAQPRTMLVFSLCNGFKHSSIPYWAKALDIMSEKTGAFKVVHSTDMSVFTKDSLKQFDVICFNNTTHLKPDASQQEAIMDFITSGKGIVGIHAATDNFYEWEDGAMMMGGIFKGHPWGGGGTWAIKIDEPEHPLMKPFKGQGFKINDEIYRTPGPHYSRDRQRVLMSLDMSDPATRNAEGVTPEDMDTGISWIKPVGKGRLFYCSLGHNHHLCWNRPVLEHYLAGIQYAMGDLKVDDTPVGNTAHTPPLDTGKLDALIADLKHYDWDKHRHPLGEIDAILLEQTRNPSGLKIIESKLLTVLDAEVSAPAADFICRKLAVIGTEQSLPVLSKMLAERNTSNMARYALEKIAVSEVDGILVKTLNATSDKDIQIGLITSLGRRKALNAMGDLAGFAKAKDPAVSAAAIHALGLLGSVKAAEELDALESTLNGPLKLNTQEALLSCAEILNDSGNTDKAQQIYRDLYRSGGTSLMKAAGLRGLVESNAADAKTCLEQAVLDSDPVVQGTAIETLAQVKNVDLLNSAAASLPKMSETLKIILITALAENPKKIGEAQAEALLKDDSKAVRLAAYQALEKLGSANSIEPLAHAAVQAQDRDERNAAQETLYRIPGRTINTAIVRKIAIAEKNNLDEQVIIQLIRATAQRQITDAPQELFRTAMSENRRIASESIRALQSLAGPDYMEEMVDLLAARPGKNTEDAVVVVGEKIQDQNERADMILRKYNEVRDENAKASMLTVMGRLGDRDSAALLKSEYASSNATTLREAAFRAMCEWPGTDFVDIMKDLAYNSTDEKTKILAFRAYVRMLCISDVNNDTAADTLIDAFKKSPRPEERKYVIDAMGNCGNPKALTFVVKMLEEPELKAEAEVSAVSICEKLSSQKAAAVRRVLEDLKNTSQNESVRNRANEILKRL